MSKCNAAGDEKKNTKDLYMRRTEQGLVAGTRSKMKFPLRVGVVMTPNSTMIDSKSINNTIAKLNVGFSEANIEFYLDRIDVIPSNYNIESISDNNYTDYNEFSTTYDLENEISLYIFDYDSHLCAISPTSISCGRTGGFAYILSNTTNNIVMSRFDLEDDKIAAHEMGHFFGLYHTFEEQQFGKDDFRGDCNVLGDCLCDTPPDPGSVYEVYINYSKCEMQSFYNEYNYEYKPLINNYMAYFKPCYLKKYSFTYEQSNILRMAAESNYRSKFAR